MFRALIMVCVLFLASTANAQYTFNYDQGFVYSGRMQSRPNIYGGYNYYQGGYRAAYSRPNTFGGKNYYTPNGYVGGTRPNVYGGYNYLPKNSTTGKKK